MIKDLSGCLDKDQRLGPWRLPTTGSAGSVYAYVAKMTHGYNPFGDSKTKDAFLTKYWDVKECWNHSTTWCYPEKENGGFATKAGKPDHYSLVLKVGTIVDRFGCGTGTYMSPGGTPFAERALPPQSLDTYHSSPPTYHYNYHLYKVVKAFKVDAGPVAPWFGQKGGGLQYVTCFTTDFTHPCGSPNVEDLLAKNAKDLEEQKLPLN